MLTVLELLPRDWTYQWGGVTTDTGTYTFTFSSKVLLRELFTAHTITQIQYKMEGKQSYSLINRS